MIAVHGIICNTKTFPTKCPRCSAGVFYFSCDCGSGVFFDELGEPWPVHYCVGGHHRPRGTAGPDYEGPSSWGSTRDVSTLRGTARRADLLPELRSGTQSIDPEIVLHVRESQSRQRDTMAIDAMGSIPIQVVGVVQHRSAPDLAKRYQLGRDSIGFAHLASRIGDTDPVQITVRVDEIATDPAAIDYFSYTFLCPRSQVGKSVRTNVVLQARLDPVEVLGVGKVWLTQSVEILY